MPRLLWIAIVWLLTMLGCLAPTYDLGIESDALPEPEFEALISDPDGRAVHVRLTCSPEDAAVIAAGHGWYLMPVEAR